MMMVMLINLGALEVLYPGPDQLCNLDRRQTVPALYLRSGTLTHSVQSASAEPRDPACHPWRDYKAIGRSKFGPQSRKCGAVGVGALELT